MMLVQTVSCLLRGPRFDWLWVLQTLRPGDDPGMGSEVKRAVGSIPAYVDAAELLVVLCPAMNTQEMCDQSTWACCGWCEAGSCGTQQKMHGSCS